MDKSKYEEGYNQGIKWVVENPGKFGMERG